MMTWMLWIFALSGFAGAISAEERIRRLEKRLAELERKVAGSEVAR